MVDFTGTTTGAAGAAGAAAKVGGEVVHFRGGLVL